MYDSCNSFDLEVNWCKYKLRVFFGWSFNNDLIFLDSLLVFEWVFFELWIYIYNLFLRFSCGKVIVKI